MRTKAGIFRKDSYDLNNDSAISKVQKYLQDNGFDVEDKAIEDYDIDVIAYKDGVKYRIEVEVKNTYFEDEGTYPFDTVSFLGRKKKYSNPGMFYYFLLSTKHNSFLYCESDIIYQEKHKETATVNTSQRYGEDLFYRVPKELCKFRQF